MRDCLLLLLLLLRLRWSTLLLLVVVVGVVIFVDDFGASCPTTAVVQQSYPPYFFVAVFVRPFSSLCAWSKSLPTQQQPLHQSPVYPAGSLTDLTPVIFRVLPSIPPERTPFVRACPVAMRYVRRYPILSYYLSNPVRPWT